MTKPTPEKQDSSPLWKAAALDVIAGTDVQELAEAEFAAVYNKAIAVMRPTLQEQKELAGNKPKQAAFIETFIHAYKAGLPPLSHLSEARKTGN